MEDQEFDDALIGAVFSLAADIGWGKASVAAAARASGVPLERARARFPGKVAVLLAFGRMADQAALAHSSADGSNRDRLFDATMRRIDVLQAHREGVLALRPYLPTHPTVSLLLGAATLTSMAWLLEASGIPAQGAVGALRVQSMNAIWLYTVRAWMRDDSVDLGATMKALDKGLDQAVRAEGWLGGAGSSGPVEVPPFPDEPELDGLGDPSAYEFAASEADLATTATEDDIADDLPTTLPDTSSPRPGSPPGPPPVYPPV